MNQDRIKIEIKSRNVDQKEFASLMGVTPSTVTLWINGKRKMSKQSKMLVKLSNKKLKEIQVPA